MGNTNEKYVEDIRTARPELETLYEQILCFKYEVDRQQVSEEERGKVGESIKSGSSVLENLLSSKEYSIIPQERESIRIIKQELAVLNGAVQDFQLESPTPEGTRLLHQRITATSENLREFLRWLDKKLERKWWLSEAIKYIRTLLKIATFISATMSVAFPYLAGPIVTLAFTVISGVIDIVDQVFVKGLRPQSVQTFTPVVKQHSVP